MGVYSRIIHNRQNIWTYGYKRYIYAVECYMAIKKKRILIHATRVNFGSTVTSERAIHKSPYCVMSFICNVQTRQMQRGGMEAVVTWGCWGKEMDTGFPFGVMKCSGFR